MAAASAQASCQVLELTPASLLAAAALQQHAPYIGVLAVLVDPLPHFVFEAQYCVVPLGKQAGAEACAALRLVAAYERQQDVGQHLTHGMMHLQSAHKHTGTAMRAGTAIRVGTAAAAM